MVGGSVGFGSYSTLLVEILDENEFMEELCWLQELHISLLMSYAVVLLFTLTIIPFLMLMPVFVEFLTMPYYAEQDVHSSIKCSFKTGGWASKRYIQSSQVNTAAAIISPPTTQSPVSSHPTSVINITQSNHRMVNGKCWFNENHYSPWKKKCWRKSQKNIERKTQKLVEYNYVHIKRDLNPFKSIIVSHLSSLSWHCVFKASKSMSKEPHSKSECKQSFTPLIILLSIRIWTKKNNANVCSQNPHTHFKMKKAFWKKIKITWDLWGLWLKKKQEKNEKQND